MATLTVQYNDATEDYLDYVDAANEIYAAATGNEPRFNGFGTDCIQPGYRAYTAEEGEAVLGFCYGFDLVQETRHWFPLRASMFVNEKLLHDTSMLAELHVLPMAQRRGLGSTLLKLWLDSITLPAVLSAYDADTPAMRLYLKNGFKVIAGNILFPGDRNTFAIMKRD